VLNGWLDTNSGNTSYSAENDELSLDDIDGIQLKRTTELQSFDDEKKDKNQNKSLFDAYKAWMNNKNDE